MQEKTSVQGSWTSRWVFVMAATGAAVGLGNIWKFPYITGENGGGAFVLVYLVCILMVGIPIMIAEVSIGRRGRKNPVSSLQDLATESGQSKLWGLIGVMAMLASVLIFSTYSVVAGWVLHYIKATATGELTGITSKNAETIFQALLADPITLFGWHTLFIIMTVVVVSLGVNKGLETATRIMMPILFLLMIVLLGYSITTKNFMAGMHFMFNFDFSKLTWGSVLSALGHSFFTLSLAGGAIMTYGSYMPKDVSIGGTVLAISALDTLIALVAGLCIFPIIFTNGMNPASGEGLMFISLPVAFAHMPGGQFFGFLFFVFVGVAAWTSSISQMEPTVAFMIERLKVTRLRASISIGVIIWALGIACLGSFSFMSDVTFFGKTIFNFLNYLTANVMLPLGGILTAIFAGWIVKSKYFKDEMSVSDLLFRYWKLSVMVVSPIAIAVVFVLNLQ